jgi:arginine N-succinyltransferase
MQSDQAAVLELAKIAGFGMTSLPADEEVLQAKIDRSVASFAGNPEAQDSESFLFVMEDPATGSVVGTTGIKAHVGRNQPFYSYKVSTLTQQSRELSLLSKHKMLHVTNDLTDCSEIGSLFLKPDYRRDRLGRVLSLCRFLFMAAHPQYFADQVIAEMRGVHDRRGNSPFYDSIARHFFEMEFFKADYLNATRGNQFINDLMPKHPIYVSLLPEKAQDVIAEPNQASAPAYAMLEKEGFRWQGYIDIFDGGPTLQAAPEQIRTIRESQQAQVRAVDDSLATGRYILTNDRFADFRCCDSRLSGNAQDGVTISSRAQKALEVNIGDTIRFIAL